MKKPPDAEHLGRSLWRRASAYTVENGLIRPSPGATFEDYEPWEVDRAAKRDEERPHRVLLRLAQQLRPYRRRRELPTRERQLLESWLRKNGLLGLLAHETLQFTTAALWHEWPPPEYRDSGEAPEGMRPLQRQVTRTSVGWRLEYHRRGPVRRLDAALLGQPVSEEDLEGVGRRIETIYVTWPKGELRAKPLGRRFEQYFPASGPREAHRRDYVSFANDDAWAEYGEPLGRFIDAAWALAAPLEGLEGWEKPTGDYRDGNAIRAIDQLNHAASVVSPMGMLLEAGGKTMAWTSPSLLGMYAVMMIEDLTGGQRVLHCPVCGGVFLSSAHQARFCSSTCRSTHHKREWRKAGAETAGGGGNEAIS